MTVQNALRVLREQRLVVTHRGRGTFIGAEDLADAAADDPVLAELDAIHAELNDLRQRVVQQDELRKVTARLDAIERAIAAEPPPAH
jgi:DNA-binding GntR family transcriptional regulator